MLLIYIHAKIFISNVANKDAGKYLTLREQDDIIIRVGFTLPPYAQQCKDDFIIGTLY